MRKDFLAPILALSLICLAISGALALTNSITEPVIVDAAKQRAEEIRAQILPEAEDFEQLELDGFPSYVAEAYASTNDVGYIIIAVTNGYGGDMKVIIGLTPSGEVIQSRVLEHSETKGLGSKVAEAPFSDQFIGIHKNWQGTIEGITGATISTNAYISAITAALETIEMIVAK